MLGVNLKVKLENTYVITARGTLKEIVILNHCPGQSKTTQLRLPFQKTHFNSLKALNITKFSHTLIMTSHWQLFN